MNQVRDAVIVAAIRTPVGRRGGALREWKTTDLLAHTLGALVERIGLDPTEVDDVIAGVVLKHGEQSGNMARNAWLGAGMPESVPGTTIDRQCGSSQQAVQFAAQAIRAGDYDFAIGSGAESMTRTELGWLFNPSAGTPEWYGDRLESRYGGPLPPQGVSIEKCAAKFGYSRSELDEFSVCSHQRAWKATENGYFSELLVPITGLTEDGDAYAMQQDEGIRPGTSIEKLAKLEPAFAPNGVITAGNSSQISDGAAAILLADRTAAESYGLRPRARIVASAVSAADPILQFTAVLPALRKALDRAKLSASDLALVEVNEAFSLVPLMVRDEFGLSDDVVNVNGGSIALGHPIGSTGARMVGMLTAELERREARFGAVVICEGGGMANATIVERLS